MRPRKKRKKNRKLKKSTRRDGLLTNSEQNKPLEREKRKKKKIPSSGTMKFQYW
jgi:hypothetical protein